MHRSRCTARCRAEGCDVSGHYAGRTSRLLCVAPISPRYDYDTRRDRSSWDRTNRNVTLHAAASCSPTYGYGSSRTLQVAKPSPRSKLKLGEVSFVLRSDKRDEYQERISLDYRYAIGVLRSRRYRSAHRGDRCWCRVCADKCIARWSRREPRQQRGDGRK